MNASTKPPLLARILAVSALVACAGCSSDTEPDGGGQIAMAAVSRESTSRGVSFEAAEVSVARLSLRACIQDAASLNVTDWPIELLHKPWPHAIFDSAVTDFCEVDVDLAPAPAASDAVPDIQDTTAIFRGTRADGTPFEIHSTLTASFVFQQDSALDAAHLVVGADLEAWLSGVDLDGADASDGSVLVDADHNPALLAAFDAGADTAFALYTDGNGDGELIGDELVPVLTTSTP